MLSNSLPADAALRTRAARVIPGGMYGHLNVARLPAGYPQFFARAEGATRTAAMVIDDRFAQLLGHDG